HARISKTSVGF
ncbi:lipocalin-like domain protein, partial [Vibrio cholerae HC-50A2]